LIVNNKIVEQGFLWFIDNLDDFILILSETGKILIINKVAAAYYGGRDPAILAGQNYFDLLAALKCEAPIVTTDLVNKNLGKIVERKQTMTLLEKQRTIVWSLTRLMGENEIDAYMLFGKDITEQNQEMLTVANGQKVEKQEQVDVITKGVVALNKEQKIHHRSHVLFVEDQSVVSFVVQNMLSNLGCDTDIAPNGQSALELVKQNHYDLIFMDIGLPDMDGYEVTRRIRKNENNPWKRVPIVALTAHASPESKQFCLDVGMNAALIKPLLGEVALDTLKTFIPNYFLAPKMMPSEEEMKSSIFTNTGKIVDFEAAKQITGLSRETVQGFLDMFVENISKDEIKLDRAFYRKDWKAVRDIIHKLRGSCDYCGTTKLKEACVRLEDYIVSEAVELRETFYQQVREEMQALKWYVKSTTNS